jgi:hypothetical protein
MDVVYPCCAGLDVHKETVAVCALWTGEKGRHQEEVRTFGTMTRDLLALSDWLASKGVTHVAMESTGVFWKPIFNILEGRFGVVLVNARHIKQVPGRKTDVKDCQWIAQLLQHGLVRGSFIPPLVLRQLRDLTRHRAQMVGEESRIANRVLKVLEDANIKLGSVASDALGVSGRAILKAIQEGEERPDVLADLARLRRENSALLPQLAFVGMSLPGEVDKERGVLHSYAFMPYLKGIDFRPLLAGHFPRVPCRFEQNITGFLSYLLMDHAAVREYPLILFISLRSGLANGVIHDGRIVAAALVAEVFPQRARAHASGIFHATSILGIWLAALAGVLVGTHWRMAYLISVAPALLTLWVRMGIREPESWKQAAARSSSRCWPALSWSPSLVICRRTGGNSWCSCPHTGISRRRCTPGSRCIFPNFSPLTCVPPAAASASTAAGSSPCHHPLLIVLYRRNGVSSVPARDEGPALAGNAGRRARARGRFTGSFAANTIGGRICRNRNPPRSFRPAAPRFVTSKSPARAPRTSTCSPTEYMNSRARSAAAPSPIPMRNR